MFSSNVSLVEDPIFRWLNHKLDEDDKRAKSLLFELLDHPLIHIVESALSIIEHRGYEEAIPLVRHLTMSNRKKAPMKGDSSEQQPSLPNSFLTNWLRKVPWFLNSPPKHGCFS